MELIFYFYSFIHLFEGVSAYIINIISTNLCLKRNIQQSRNTSFHNFDKAIKKANTNFTMTEYICTDWYLPSFWT